MKNKKFLLKIEEEPSIQVKSYAKAVDPKAGQRITIAQSNSELCPYYLVGECRYAEECAYIHGEFCELCSHHCLHPSDEAQRQQHIQVLHLMSLSCT